MLKSTSSEIIHCNKCKEYFELYYDDQGNVTSELSCRCRNKIKLINGMKPLDWALKEIKKDLLKIKRGTK